MPQKIYLQLLKQFIMKKLILAIVCIAAITTFASCTADNVNDSTTPNPKSKLQYSKIGDTIGNGDKGTTHG